jgi:hypothetical protein
MRYYFDEGSNESERLRVHDRPECITLARLNGIVLKKPVLNETEKWARFWVRPRICCGCGQSFLKEEVTDALV